MRVERAVDSTMKKSRWLTTPAQSGIQLVFMPDDRVTRTIVRMDKCTCVDT